MLPDGSDHELRSSRAPSVGWNARRPAPARFVQFFGGAVPGLSTFRGTRRTQAGIGGRSELERFKRGNGVLWRQWAPLPLRLMIGYGFIAHGSAKLSRGPEKEMWHSSFCCLFLPRPGFPARTVGLRRTATLELCVSRRDATYLVGIVRLAGGSRPSFPGVRAHGKVLRGTVRRHWVSTQVGKPSDASSYGSWYSSMLPLNSSRPGEPEIEGFATRPQPLATSAMARFV
jgi:hypothetical protein